MGKVILCTGRITDAPYVFMLSNKSVYSIEEMSYYLYTHIYEIENDFLNGQLLNWIRFELAMDELAEKLESMMKNGNGLKDIIVTILCSNDYYTEKEIKELIQIMDAIKGLPSIKRRKIRGDYYLRYKMYHNAMMEYENILKDKEVSNFAPEEYGNLLHNIGIVKIQTSSYEQASYYFKEAYNLNHNEVSLTQYMLSLLIAGEQELYASELERYELKEEFTEMLYEEITKKEVEAKGSYAYQGIEALDSMHKSGYNESYDRKVNDIVTTLKATYRRHIEG